MAKGKYQKWLKPANLERITNWAIKGCTDEEIARNMGIRRQTLYDWFNKHGDISDAVKTGRELSIDCIENMAFKVAMGLAEEEVMVKVKNADGTESAQMRKRKLPPNPSMLMFLLKNRAGYRSEPKDDTISESEQAPTFVYER